MFMAGYIVSNMTDDIYSIVSSNQVILKGLILKDGYFICKETGKKAKLLGTLKHEFKRSIFRNGNNEDYVLEKENSDRILYEALNAIDESAKPTVQDYILLSNWE